MTDYEKLRETLKEIGCDFEATEQVGKLKRIKVESYLNHDDEGVFDFLNFDFDDDGRFREVF